jgi:hypothetical protein
MTWLERDAISSCGVFVCSTYVGKLVSKPDILIQSGQPSIIVLQYVQGVVTRVRGQFSVAQSVVLGVPGQDKRVQRRRQI